MAAEHRGLSVSRRRFVLGAGFTGLGVLAGCGRLPGHAPPAPTRPYRIGFLNHTGVSGAADDPTRVEDRLREALRDLGYIDGGNVVIEARYTGNRAEHLTPFAVELTQLPVDLITTVPGPATAAAQAATRTIPIVHIVGLNDLVADGLVASWAHPGGNITGVGNYSPEELIGKWLELLKAVAPHVARVAILTPGVYFRRGEGEAAARQLGLEIEYFRTGLELSDTEPVLEALAQSTADGLVVIAAGNLLPYRQRIVDLAATRRMPAVYGLPQYVREGGLMAYAPNQFDNVPRAAALVDKILKGGKPAEIPIERPMRFAYALNLNTAQALGLTIPPHVLLQATEVIQ
jgi:putative ABC transport system substrate-binding protein